MQNVRDIHILYTNMAVSSREWKKELSEAKELAGFGIDDKYE